MRGKTLVLPPKT